MATTTTRSRASATPRRNAKRAAEAERAAAYERAYKGPTVNRDRVAKLAAVNSPRLPQVVNDGGTRMQFVGIGWVDEGPARGDEPLLVDGPGTLSLDPPAPAKPAAAAKPLKLAELAARIGAYLKRFEADPKINRPDPKYRTQPYYHPFAGVAGAYVKVTYVTYQGGRNLTRGEAIRYLARLDAGGVGTHWDLARAAASALRGWPRTSAGWDKAYAATVAALGSAEGVQVAAVGPGRAARLVGMGPAAGDDTMLYGDGGTRCTVPEALDAHGYGTVGAVLRAGL